MLAFYSNQKLFLITYQRWN